MNIPVRFFSGIGIANTFIEWKEVEKYSRVVTREEIAKNDFRISPSRYIQSGEGEEYRAIAEIADELRDLDNEIHATSGQLEKVLAAIGA